MREGLGFTLAVWEKGSAETGQSKACLCQGRRPGNKTSQLFDGNLKPESFRQGRLLDRLIDSAYQP